MEFGRCSFPLPSLNSMRQKQRLAAHRSFQRLHYSSAQKDQSVASQVANLKQFISAYFDSIQMVCQAGSWLADTFSVLLAESTMKNVADEMKAAFNKILQFSVSATMQAKNDLAFILLELSLPNTHHVQNIRNSQLHNAKVLQRCIKCLSDVHNSLFKIEMNINVDLKNGIEAEHNSDRPTSRPSEQGTAVECLKEGSDNYSSEWWQLRKVESNVKSWRVLKERTSQFLRKYNGLTEIEIQNLVNHGNVSELYLEKLNQRIDTALRNYEVGLRNLSTDPTTVFGGFYSSPKDARNGLAGCCSRMEIEQGSQRLPVTQFLQCELPLMTISINGREYPSSGHNSSANFNSKKNAVRMILQSCDQKLSISQTDNLSSEILGDVCPARWRAHVKACLQLLFGNAGLVIMDTVSSESNTKQNAVINSKNDFVVVSITSIWCLKEDPGTMSLLQRHVDPEKTLATVNVRYVSIFSIKAQGANRFQPGVFVETFLQTGSKNRRRASSSIHASNSLQGTPLTQVSTYWLTNTPVSHPSPISLERILCNESSVVMTSDTSGPGASSEIKRKKRLFVEVKEDDSSADECKSSDNEDSVKDVIQMLSGSRISTRKQHKFEQTSQESYQQENHQCGHKSIPESQIVEDRVQSEKPVLEAKSSACGRFGTMDCPGDSSGAKASDKDTLLETVTRQTCEGSRGVTFQQHKFKSQSLPGGFGRSQPEFPVVQASYFAKDGPLSYHHKTGRDLTANGMASSRSELVRQGFVAGQPVCMNLTATCTNYRGSSTPSVPDHDKLGFVSADPSTAPWLHGASCKGIRSSNQYISKLNPDLSLLSVETNTSNTSSSQPVIQQQEFNICRNMKDKATSEHIQLTDLQQAPPYENMNMVQQNRNNNNMSSTNNVNEQATQSAHYSHCNSYLYPFAGENIDSLKVQAHKKANPYGPGIGHRPSRDLERDEGPFMADDQNMDELVRRRLEDSLGPIGSPILKGSSKVERSMLWEPFPSYTWPFTQDLQNIKTGESEYTQYVAEVVKKAMLRKQTSKSLDIHQESSEDALWDGNKWLSPNAEQLFPRTATTWHNADASDQTSRCKQDDTKDFNAVKTNRDATRTGTWPPWQLWPNGDGL